MQDSSNDNLLLPDANWQLWYQDLFDPDCPRQLEQSGQGLVAGLKALWMHHLREAVLLDGGMGLARFNLWWQQEKRSVSIHSVGAGITKLKHWVLQPDPVFDPSAAGKPNQWLLIRIAQAHCRLIAKGQDEARLCQMAAQSETMDKFIDTLAEI